MIYQGHIVDVVAHEIFDGSLVVENKKIVAIKRESLPVRKKCELHDTFRASGTV